MLNRRLLLLAFAAVPGAASARNTAGFSHRGHSVDMTGCPPRRRPAVSAWVRQQIDLVEGLAIGEDSRAWFRSIPISINPDLPSPGRFSARGGLELKDVITPADNPVLLHELLHGYHRRRLTQAQQRRIDVFFAEAAALGRWPADAYMLSNVAEFFAMTASVALWGRAARPPDTRRDLRTAMPDYYAWLADHFGLQA